MATEKFYKLIHFSPDALKVLNRLRDMLIGSVSRFVGRECSDLERLHDSVTDKEFDELHFFLTNALWDSGLHLALMRAEMNQLTSFFGLDLDIQFRPHLRITRPNRPSDNVGLHRDIDYGASIYEYSLWTPISYWSDGGGMKLLNNSIKKGYDGYEMLVQETSHTKGSKKNISGHPYKTNNVKLTSIEYESLEEPRVDYGSCLVIPQMMVHGSEVNTSGSTRVSFDMRIVNAQVIDERSTLAKRKITHSQVELGAVPYYQPFNRSYATKMSETFKSLGNISLSNKEIIGIAEEKMWKE